MSKKLASGADAIVLDVKTGSGAFMKQEEDAFALAKEMVTLGNKAGRRTIAVVSDMDQPLGCAVGNALEVEEAIATLKGEGPEDFTKLCMTLGSYMLIVAGAADNEKEAEEKLSKVIEDGSALRKLAEFVTAQGGNADAVYDTSLLPKASITEDILSEKEGYVEKIDCEEIGLCSLMLGGGRETKESIIDLSVGLVLHKKVGAYVHAGDTLATIYANDKEKLEAAKSRFLKAYHFGKEAPAAQTLIKGVVRE
jgi:pyrimidine-nucleoside phosphorylase